jgi:tetratricopeptide (TPR) repeat protein
MKTQKQRRSSIIVAVTALALATFGWAAWHIHSRDVSRMKAPNPANPSASPQAGLASHPETRISPGVSIHLMVPGESTRLDEAVEEGRRLRERGDTYAAVTKLREAAAYDPSNPAPIAELAITYEKMGFFENAVQCWKRVYDLGETAGGYFAAASAKLDAGGNAYAAMTKLRETAANDPSNPAPIAELATTYEKMGFAGRAAECWKRIYDLGATAGLYFEEAKGRLDASKAEAAPTLAKTVGLGPTSKLGFDRITRTEENDAHSLEKFTLHVPVRAKLRALIDAADVTVRVLFYDTVHGVEGKPIEVNASNVHGQWESSPADWSERDVETFDATCARPLPPPGQPIDDRRCYGYIASVYYKNALQDFRSDPPQLAQQAPPPRSLPEAGAFPENVAALRDGALRGLEPQVIIPTKLRPLVFRNPLPVDQGGKASAKRDEEVVLQPPSSNEPAPSGSVAAGVIDTGLGAASRLGFDTITRTDEPDSSTLERFTLHIPVKAKPPGRIDVAEVTMRVLLYDVVNRGTAGQLEINRANVTWRPESSPPDWSKRDVETFNVTYSRPYPGRGEPIEDRKYYGYVVGIYCKNVLQDFRSDPPGLAQQAPLPRTLSK